ncbi:MAG: DUF6785 family protein [bacterium]
MDHELTKGFTLKSALIGSFLIPISTYWVMRMEIMSGNVGGGGTSFGGAHYSTCLSIFFNVIFIIILIVITNHIWKKLFIKNILKSEEILTIYIILSMSTAVAGTDMLQVLIPMLGHPYWFATPENEWESLFFRYLPKWLTVPDKSILRDFYEGQSTFYTVERIKVWILPLVSWTFFLLFLILIMICINIFIKKQWIERERLSYPIIHIPCSIVGFGGSKLFSNKMFWIGFCLAGGIDLYNGMAYLFPSLPFFHIKYEISHLFPMKPWNAMGWTNFALFPFAIGLGYMIPVDLSFSCWFFFLFTKMQRIITSHFGYGYKGFPYIREQSFGAYMGICFFALYIGRKHILSVLQKVFRKKYNESYEEIRTYRLAIFGFIVSSIFILIFCLNSGMSIKWIFGFFTLYFLLSLSITRMRAELGVPAHDLHLMDPSVVLTTTFGSRHIGSANLTMFSLFYFFNRAYRSHPMPHSLEGFKIAEQMRIKDLGLFYAMLLGTIIGIISALWILVDGFYKLGASARISGYAISAFGREPYDRLQNWLVYPSSPNHLAELFMFIGFLFTIILLILRTQLIWWKIHPLGYALADDYSMQWLWASLFLSWLLKSSILKYGGVKQYRHTIPLFIGLILGEFTIGSIWSIIGIIFNMPTYAFKYW